MIRDNLQIGTSAQYDPADPTAFVYYTDNASSGYNYGAELEGTQKVGEYVDLFATLGLLDTEYQDYESAAGIDTLDGREQPYAPNYSYSVGTQWHCPQGFFARAEVEGKDGFYLSDGDNQQSDPYALLNLSTGYGRDNWTLSLWGRNVLDKQYVTRGYFFGLEPPEFADKLYVTYGDPAQFGATLDVVF